jgi:8-oxo-dGTP pyrophosphatase MutT (NUDIX family)
VTMTESALAAVRAHPEIARLAMALHEHPGEQVDPEGPTRLAAVLLVLRLGDQGEPELLMIKRAEAERDPWSGHVACPGGRMEPGDHDLEQTAIRETWEETGIDIARDGEILGTLDDLAPRTPVLPPIVVRPYVGVVRPDVRIVASPEVAEAFWVPLPALRERAAWGMGLVSIRGREEERPTFRHGGYTVWGLTERVLRQLLERLGEGS